MTGTIQAVMDRHGQRMTLRRKDGETETRAFLQPVTERREQEAGEPTALGTVDERRWLYLGRCAVDTGDRVLWNGMELQVCSSRPYYAGETLLYWWASLERAKEEA